MPYSALLERFTPSGSIERDVIASSWSGPDKPTAVYLDTSELGIRDADLGLALMLNATSTLAGVALEWYNTRDA